MLSADELQQFSIWLQGEFTNRGWNFAPFYISEHLARFHNVQKSVENVLELKSVSLSFLTFFNKIHNE